MFTFVGIDVSARTLDVVLLVDNRAPRHRVVDNTPAGHRDLLAWLRTLSAPRVVCEATGVYHLDLAFTLVQAGIALMVVNPRQAKQFAEARNRHVRTDAIDALELAEFVKRMDFVPWTAPSATAWTLHKLGRLLGAIKLKHTAAANQLHAATASVHTPKTVIRLLKQELTLLQRQIAQLSTEMDRSIANDPRLRRQQDLLLSVPGIGSTSALALLAELVVLPPDLSAKAWTKYAGLDPSLKQSGTSVLSKTRIAKRGNARLRAALFMPAMAARRHEPHIAAFFQRLVDHHKTKLQAIVAIQRKLLCALHAMLKLDQPWDGAKLVPTRNTAANTS